MKNKIELKLNTFKQKAVIVSGYFNPIHKGHIELFNRAKELGDYLIVIVNSDFQRSLKGSKEFQNQEERLLIVENIRAVDYALISVDKDRSVKDTIRQVFNLYHGEYQLYFANGGDQNNQTIPEYEICLNLGIQLIDNLGNKIQSSSWLLKS